MGRDYRENASQSLWYQKGFTIGYGNGLLAKGRGEPISQPTPHPNEFGISVPFDEKNPDDAVNSFKLGYLDGYLEAYNSPDIIQRPDPIEVQQMAKASFDALMTARPEYKRIIPIRNQTEAPMALQNRYPNAPPAMSFSPGIQDTSSASSLSPKAPEMREVSLVESGSVDKDDDSTPWGVILAAAGLAGLGLWLMMGKK